MIKTIFREAKMPLPIEKIDSSGLVKCGTDNLYRQWLNGLYYDNSVHGGIINQKVKFITAGGVDVLGADKTLLQNFNSAFSIQEVIDSIALDFEIGECFYLKFIKIGESKWKMEAVDFELIRSTEEMIYFLYSEDWAKDKKGTPIKSINHLDLKADSICIMEVMSRPKQRSFQHQKGLTANYYPVVNYSGALTDILAGIEMSYFTFSEVVNSFKGGTMISLGNGVPETDEMRDKITKEIKDEATSRETQGGLVVAFHDGADRKPEVLQINGNDLDKRYDQTKRTCRDSILIAHGVISPALFGVLSESMFGSKDEMELAYVLFQENYVAQRQRVIEASINWAYKKLNLVELGLKFNEYVPPFIQKKEVVPVKMSKEFTDEEVISEFAKVGSNRSEFKIVNSQSFDFETSDEDFIKNSFKTTFAISLTEIEKTILTMISNDEDYNSIVKAIGKGGSYVSSKLVKLGKLGLLDGWKVTDKGLVQTVAETELKVLYSYEKKANAPDLVKGGESRPFCKQMLDMDKVYTRSEIDTISSKIGRDVWSYRGGWYHNPEDGKNRPSCRHEWKQNIVINIK